MTPNQQRQNSEGSACEKKAQNTFSHSMNDLKWRK